MAQKKGSGNTGHDSCNNNEIDYGLLYANMLLRNRLIKEFDLRELNFLILLCIEEIQGVERKASLDIIANRLHVTSFRLKHYINYDVEKGLIIIDERKEYHITQAGRNVIDTCKEYLSRLKDDWNWKKGITKFDYSS